MKKDACVPLSRSVVRIFDTPAFEEPASNVSATSFRVVAIRSMSWPSAHDGRAHCGAWVVVVGGLVVVLVLVVVGRVVVVVVRLVVRLVVGGLVVVVVLVAVGGFGAGGATVGDGLVLLGVSVGVSMVPDVVVGAAMLLEEVEVLDGTGTV